MSYSDDYASPQAPFSGDDSGDIFDMPDIIWQQKAQERVVDTQSGFLIVIKHTGLRDNRLQLSFKRSVGTPPSSSIVLTPDESLKLSKILSSPPPENKSELKLEGKLSESVDEWLEQMTTEKLPTPKNEQEYRQQREERRKKRSRATARRLSENIQTSLDYIVLDSRFRVLLLIFCIAVAGALFFGVSTAFKQAHVPVSPSAGTNPPLALTSEQDVSKFASAFVGDLYDKTLEAQVRAMSKMNAELLNKYASANPLTTLSKNAHSAKKQSVLITRVEQGQIQDGQKDVDVQGELLGENLKVESKVHVKLKVKARTEAQSEPQLQVADWQEVK